MNNLGRNVLIWLRYFLLGILLFFVIWFVWEYVLIIGTYNKLVNILLYHLEWNIWTVRAVGIVFTLVTVVFVYPLVDKIFSPFTSANRRRIALTKLSSILVLYCLFMLGFSKTNEDKCYTIDFEGNYIICNCTESEIHPRYMSPIKPMTKEIARYIERKKNGELNEKYFMPSDKYHFFSSDGTALVWYYISPEGKYSFSEIPGTHKIYGEPLKPVTVKIVKEYFQYLRKNNIEIKEKSKQEEFYENLSKF